MEFLKKSIPTPWNVIRNSWGRRVSQAKILEAKYEAKLEFPRGMEVQKKNLPWEEYEYSQELLMFQSVTQAYLAKKIQVLQTEVEQMAFQLLVWILIPHLISFTYTIHRHSNPSCMQDVCHMNLVHYHSMNN